MSKQIAWDDGSGDVITIQNDSGTADGSFTMSAEKCTQTGTDARTKTLKVVGGDLEYKQLHVSQPRIVSTTRYAELNSIGNPTVEITTETTSDGLIIAKGGRARAKATVSYKYYDRAVYTDGSYIDGAKNTATMIIYGDYVTADSKGTTESAITNVGTSTPTDKLPYPKVDGTTITVTASAKTISQEANAITSTVYSTPVASWSSTPDVIAASGGTDTCPDFTYTQTQEDTYTSTDVKKTTLTTGGTKYYAEKTGSGSISAYSTDRTTITVSADDMGTTELEQRVVGTFYGYVTMNGKTSSTISVDVSQSKNEFIGYEYDAPTFTLSSVADIAASGGTSAVPTISDAKQVRYYCYTSGEKIKSDTITTGLTIYYGTSSDPTSTSSSSCQITKDSLGSTEKDRTQVGYASIKIVGSTPHSGSAKSTVKRVAVYQAANAKGTYTASTRTLNVDTSTLVPGACSMSVTGSCVHTGKYTSGTEWTETYALTSISLKSGASSNFTVDNTTSPLSLNHATMGTNVSTDSCVVVGVYSCGHTKESSTISVANAVDHYGTPTGLSFTLADIPASGATGNATMFSTYGTVSGTCSQVVYYTSGAEETITPQYSNVKTQSDKTSYDSLGTTEKVRSSVGTFTYQYAANGVNSTAITVTIYQQANVATYGILGGTLSISVGDIPASGGTKTTADCTTVQKATQTVSYTSGDKRDGTITYSVSGSAVSADSLEATEKVRTRIKASAFTITAVGEGTKMATAWCDVYQAANAITSEVYAVPNFTTLPSIDAGDFTSALTPTTVTDNVRTFTSGKSVNFTTNVNFTIDSQTYNNGTTSTTISRFSINSTPALVHTSMTNKVGTDNVTVRATNAGDSTKYKTLSGSASNALEKGVRSASIDDSNLSASGGTATPTGRCTHTFTSGYEQTFAITNVTISSKTGTWSIATASPWTITHGAMSTSATGATVTDTITIGVTFECGHTASTSTSVQNTVVSTFYAMPSVSIGTGLSCGNSSATVSHPPITGNYWTYDHGTQYFTSNSTISIQSQTYTPMGESARTTNRFSLDPDTDVLSHSTMSSYIGYDSVTIKASNDADETGNTINTTAWTSDLNAETHTPQGSIGSGITAAGGSATVSGKCVITQPSGATSNSPISSIAIKSQTFTATGASSSSAISRFSVSGTTLSHTSMTTNAGTDSVTVTITYACGTTFDVTTTVTNAYSSTTYATPTVSIGSGITASGGSATVTHADITTNYYTYTSGKNYFTTSSTIAITTNGNSRFSLSGNTLSHSNMTTNITTDTVVITATNSGDSSKTATSTTSATNAIESHSPAAIIGSGLTAAGGSATVTGQCVRTLTAVNSSGVHYTDTKGIKSVEITSQTYTPNSGSASTISRFSVSGTTISHTTMSSNLGTDTVTIKVTFNDTEKTCTATTSKTVTNAKPSPVYATPTVSIGSGLTAAGGSATVTHADITGNYYEYTSGYKEYFTTTSTIAITTNGNSRFHLSGNTLSHDSMTSDVTTDTVVVTATNSGDSSKTATASTSVANAEGTHTQTASWYSNSFTAAGGSAVVTGTDTFKYTSTTDGSYAISGVAIQSQYFIAEGSTTHTSTSAFYGVTKVSDTQYSVSHATMGTNAGTDYVTMRVTFADGHYKDVTANVSNTITSTTYATPTITASSGSITAGGGSFVVSCPDVTTNYYTYTSTSTKNFTTTPTISLSQTCAGNTNRFTPTTGIVNGTTISHSTMGTTTGTDSVTLTATNGNKTKDYTTSATNSVTHTPAASIGSGLTPAASSATISGQCTLTYTSGSETTSAISGLAITSQKIDGVTITRYSVSSSSPWTLSHTTMGTVTGTDSVTVRVTYACGTTKDISTSVTNSLKSTTYATPTVSIGSGLTAGGGSATVTHADITTNYYTYTTGATENFTTSSTIAITTNGNSRFHLSGNTLSHDSMTTNDVTDTVTVTATNGDKTAKASESITNKPTHTPVASVGTGITAAGGSATVSGSCTVEYPSGSKPVYGISSVSISSQTFTPTSGSASTITRYSISGTTLSHTTMAKNVGTDACTVTAVFEDGSTKTASTSVVNSVDPWTYTTPAVSIGSGITAGGGSATVSHANGSRSRSYTSTASDTESVATTIAITAQTYTPTSGSASTITRFSLSGDTLSHTTMAKNAGTDSVTVTATCGDKTNTATTSVTNTTSHAQTLSIGSGITAAGGSATVSGYCRMTYTSGSTTDYAISSVTITSQTYNPGSSTTGTTRFHISGTTLSHDSMTTNTGTDTVYISATFADGHTATANTSAVNAITGTTYATPTVSIGDGLTAAGGSATVTHADITTNYYTYTSTATKNFTTSSTISVTTQTFTPTGGSASTITRFSLSGNTLSHTTMAKNIGNDYVVVTAVNSGSSAKTATATKTIANAATHTKTASVGSGVTAGGGSATVTGNCTATYTSNATADVYGISSVSISSQTFTPTSGSASTITRYSISGTTLSHTTMGTNVGTDACTVTVVFSDGHTTTASTSVANAKTTITYSTPDITVSGNTLSASGGSASVTVQLAKNKQNYTSGTATTDIDSSYTLKINSQTFTPTSGSASTITRFSLSSSQILSHTTMGRNFGTDYVQLLAYNNDATSLQDTWSTSLTNADSHSSSAAIGSGITAAGGSATVTGSCTSTSSSGEVVTYGISSVSISSQAFTPTSGGSSSTITRFSISGTTLSHTTMGQNAGVDTVVVLVTFEDGHTTTATKSVTNAKTGTYYATPSVSIGDGLTAAGGSATVTHGTITTNYYTYTSGTYYFNTTSTITGITQTCIGQSTGTRFSISGNTISHTTMGTNAGSDTVIVTVKNDGDSSKTATDYKTISNQITNHNPGFGTTIQAWATTTAVSGYCTRTYTSTATDTSALKSISITSQTYTPSGGSATTTNRFSVSGLYLTHNSMEGNAGTDSVTLSATFDDDCTASLTLTATNTAGSWAYATPTVSIGSGLTAAGGSATVTHDNSTRSRGYTSKYVETVATSTTIAISSQTFTSESSSTSGITRFSLSGNTLSHTTMGKNLGRDTVYITVTNGDATASTSENIMNSSTHTQTASIGSGITAAGGSATVSGNCTVTYTSNATADVYAISSVSIASQTCVGGTPRYSISGTTLSHTTMGTNAGNDVVNLTVTFTDGHTKSVSTTVSNAYSSTTYATPTVSIGSGITAGGGSATVTHANITGNYYTYTSGKNYFTTTSTIAITTNGNSRFHLSGNTLSHDSMTTNETTDTVVITATNSGDSTKTATATTSVTNSVTPTHTQTYSTSGSYTAAGGYVTYSGNCTATGTYTSGDPYSATYPLSSVSITSQTFTPTSGSASTITRFSVNSSNALRVDHTSMLKNVGTDAVSLTLTYSDGHTKTTSASCANSKGSLQTATPTISLNPNNLTAAGGSATVVHANCGDYYQYTSGSVDSASVATTIAITTQTFTPTGGSASTISRFSLSSNTLSHTTMGTNIGTDYVVVTATNPHDTSKTATVSYSIANAITAHSPSASIGSGMTAAGGSASVTGQCTRTYTSGSTSTSAISSVSITSNGNSRFHISGTTLTHDTMGTDGTTTDSVTVTVTFADSCTTTATKSITNTKTFAGNYIDAVSTTTVSAVGSTPHTFATVPAGGGTINANGLYYYTYTSGSSNYETNTTRCYFDSVPSWFTRLSSGDSYQIASRGTTVGSARTFDLVWYDDDDNASPAVTLTQAANSGSATFTTAPTFGNTVIAANGGSSYLSNAPVVKVSYTSGSSFTTTYPDTTYGTWTVNNQTATSKGKTESGVTSVGNANVVFTTSSTYGSVSVTSANTAITQAANVKYSSYDNPSGLSISTSDVSAAGVTTYSPTGTVSGTCTQRCYYSSGSYDDNTVSYSGTFTANITSVSSRATTEGERKSVGTLTYTYTANGKSNTATCTIYQAANVKTLTSTNSNYSPSSYTASTGISSGASIGTAASSTTTFTVSASHQAYYRYTYSWTSGETTYENSSSTHTVADNVTVSINDTTNFSLSATSVASGTTITLTHKNTLSPSTSVKNSDYNSSDSGYTADSVSIGSGLSAGASSATITATAHHTHYYYYLYYSNSRSVTVTATNATSTSATGTGTVTATNGEYASSQMSKSVSDTPTLAVYTQNFTPSGMIQSQSITRFSISGTTLSHTTMGTNEGTDYVQIRALNGSSAVYTTAEITNAIDSTNSNYNPSGYAVTWNTHPTSIGKDANSTTTFNASAAHSAYYQYTYTSGSTSVSSSTHSVSDNVAWVISDSTNFSISTTTSSSGANVTLTNKVAVAQPDPDDTDYNPTYTKVGFGTCATESDTTSASGGSIVVYVQGPERLHNYYYHYPAASRSVTVTAKNATDTSKTTTQTCTATYAAHTSSQMSEMQYPTSATDITFAIAGQTFTPDSGGSASTITRFAFSGSNSMSGSGAYAKIARTITHSTMGTNVGYDALHVTATWGSETHDYGTLVNIHNVVTNSEYNPSYSNAVTSVDSVDETYLKANGGYTTVSAFTQATETYYYLYTSGSTSDAHTKTVAESIPSNTATLISITAISDTTNFSLDSTTVGKINHRNMTTNATTDGLERIVVTGISGTTATTSSVNGITNRVENTTSSTSSTYTTPTGSYTPTDNLSRIGGSARFTYSDTKVTTVTYTDTYTSGSTKDRTSTSTTYPAVAYTVTSGSSYGTLSSGTVSSGASNYFVFNTLYTSGTRSATIKIANSGNTNYYTNVTLTQNGYDSTKYQTAIAETAVGNLDFHSTGVDNPSGDLTYVASEYGDRSTAYGLQLNGEHYDVYEMSGNYIYGFYEEVTILEDAEDVQYLFTVASNVEEDTYIESYYNVANGKVYVRYYRHGQEDCTAIFEDVDSEIRIAFNGGSVSVNGETSSFGMDTSDLEDYFDTNATIFIGQSYAAMYAGSESMDDAEQYVHRFLVTDETFGYCTYTLAQMTTD